MRPHRQCFVCRFAVASIANFQLVFKSSRPWNKPKTPNVLPGLCHAPASDEAPPIGLPTSANRWPRRYKFHRERPATPPCLLALPADVRHSPKEKARAREPPIPNRAAVNWDSASGYNRGVRCRHMGAVSRVLVDLSWRRGI